MIKECTVHVRIRDITPNPGNSEKNKIIVQLNGRATVQQIERWRLQVRARIPENYTTTNNTHEYSIWWY